ncbi:hypothetical protein HYW35_02275 [Candidatus Saccharibacteria bacterium]|nr:hypothetical protein [Candidatus Saccharibacteria bacterium]
MKSLTTLKIFLISLAMLLGTWVFTPLALAQGFDPFCSKVDPSTGKCTEGVCVGEAATGPVCQQKKAQQTKKDNPAIRVIHTATNILALVAGVGAVIIIIYSGYVFVTAGGAIGGQRSGDNPTRARQARSSLIGALIGLIIVALSWSIITFFTNRLL